MYLITLITYFQIPIPIDSDGYSYNISIFHSITIQTYLTYNYCYFKLINIDLT